uniref:Tumor protein p63 regulated 1 n=1 Tax=Neolamprologus brichardi TaxID=32507 RepID=A0A3Q4H4J6_NEOBR
MADAEDEVVKGSEEQQQQAEEEVDLSSSPTPPEDSQTAAGRKGDAQERPAESVATSTQGRHLLVEPTLDQFKLRKFFVLRPGTLNQAIKDVEALVNEEVDGSVLSVWLMAERNGEGVRVFWDRLREPSFTSRWNPFATDFPFITFTYHPVRKISDVGTLCSQHVEKFREQLKDAAQKVHTLKPVPGKANGVLVLNQPIQIEAYVGFMSFLGNENKLGYCMARGNLGF